MNLSNIQKKWNIFEMISPALQSLQKGFHDLIVLL